MGEYTLGDAVTRYNKWLAIADRAGWKISSNPECDTDADWVRLPEAAETVRLLAAALRAAKEYRDAVIRDGVWAKMTKRREAEFDTALEAAKVLLEVDGD